MVLYFYPKDFRSGCTEDVWLLRDSLDGVKLHQAVVLGVSVDKSNPHRHFSSTYDLPFTLIADEDRAICTSFGALWLFGIIAFPKRVTCFIDRAGIIRRIVHRESDINEHIRKVIET